jgi:ankyrin repeat protein
MEYIGIKNHKINAVSVYSDKDIDIYELNYNVIEMCMDIPFENIIYNQQLLSWCNKFKKYEIVKKMCSSDKINLYSLREEIDNVDLLHFLHLRGLDISIKKNPTLLLSNIRQQNIILIDYILKNNNVFYSDLDFAILESCKIGNHGIFKLLTTFKFNPNYNNNIFLLTAAEYGHLHIVQSLLDLGANIFTNNYMVLQKSIDHLDVFFWILFYIKGKNIQNDINFTNALNIILVDRILNNKVHIVQFLVENYNGLIIDDNTMLWCIKKGFVECYRLLFEYKILTCQQILESIKFNKRFIQKIF